MLSPKAFFCSSNQLEAKSISSLLTLTIDLPLAIKAIEYKSLAVSYITAVLFEPSAFVGFLKASQPSLSISSLEILSVLYKIPNSPHVYGTEYLSISKPFSVP